jgi:hypothetical protein
MHLRDICAIHQPNLFPRLSTLAKLYLADLWIVLDNVQFTRRDYRHRCKLARLNNPWESQWLSLSVHRPHGRASRINEITVVDHAKCRKRVERLLQEYYGRSLHWPLLHTQLRPLLDTFATTPHQADIAEASTRLLLDLVGWHGTIRRSSELPSRSGRSARLADLTRATGAGTYLCGSGGKRYLDTAPFAEQGLAVHYVELPAARGDQGLWRSPRQVSALWALMAFGPEALRDELTNLRKIHEFTTST